jgi:hypothetical protein
MKYLKLFDSRSISKFEDDEPEKNIINIYNKENLPPNLKFKIGDYVRSTWAYNIKNIYQIVAYNSYLHRWYLADTLELNGFSQPDQFWIYTADLVLVPEYEIDAIKYNL